MASLTSSSGTMLLLLFLALPTSNALMQWLSPSGWLSTPKSTCPHLTCCFDRWSNVSETKGLQFFPGDACDGTFVYTPEFKDQLTKACDCYDQYPEQILKAFGSPSPVLKLLMRTHCERSSLSFDEQARLRREFCDDHRPRPPPMMSPHEIDASILRTECPTILMIGVLPCLACIYLISFYERKAKKYKNRQFQDQKFQSQRCQEEQEERLDLKY